MRKGGLKIYTTIDLDKQKAARAAMKGQLTVQRRPVVGDRVDRPAQRLHPRDGVVAQLRHVKFNYAAQGHRQAGSTFKVMVLMTALRKGIDPNTTTYVSHR